MAYSHSGQEAERPRKITFADTDDVAPVAPSTAITSTAGTMYMNPERLAALKRPLADGSGVLLPPVKKVKKEKTVAKQRYLRKKMQKRKTRLKAAKASAPKSSKHQEAVDIDGQGSETSEDTDAESDEDSQSNNSSQPVKLVASSRTVSAYPAVVKPSLKKPEPVAVDSSLPESSDAQAPAAAAATTTTSKTETTTTPSEETVEQRRERRRLEKKAKREVRRAEEKLEAERAAIKQQALKEEQKEQQARKAAQKAQHPDDEDVNMQGSDAESSSDSDSSFDTSDSSAESDAESSSFSQHSINPEGIPSFPLPLAPPKPSQALLSRQGLPEALQDAVLISEDEKTSVQDLQLIQRTKGVTRELSDHIKGRLAALGISQLFAGMSYDFLVYTHEKYPV